MNKKTAIIALIIVLIGGTIIWHQINNNANSITEQNTNTTNNETPLPEVSIMEVGNQNSSISFQKIGSVKANKQSNVIAETTGYIANVQVEVGDYVEEGQLLASLDDSLNTKLLAINQQFSQKDKSLALSILQAMQEGSAADIDAMENSVQNALLNYQTLLSNYNNSVQSINQQVISAKLALNQAHESYNSQNDIYQETVNGFFINHDNLYESVFKQDQAAYATIQLALETADLAYGKHNIKNIGIRGPIKQQIDGSTYNKADFVYEKAWKQLAELEKLIQKAQKDLNQDDVLDLNDKILDVLDEVEAILLTGDNFLKNISTDPKMGLDAQIALFNTKMQQDLGSINQNRSTLKQMLNGIDSSYTGNNLQITNLDKQIIQSELQVKTASHNLEQTKNSAQIQLNNLQSQIENAKNLYESSKAQLNSLKSKSRTQTIQAQTTVNNTDKQLASTSAQLDTQNIKAPFAGIVSAVKIKEGNLASTGQTVITIEDPEETIVETTATEEELTFITEGSEVVIKNSNGDESQGYVSKINSFSGDQNGLFKVEVSIIENNQLKNGTFVKLQFNSIQEQDTSMVLVPMKSVFFAPGHKTVYVLNETGMIEEREIKAGKIVGQNIEIESGLQMGDKLIIDGARNLKPGDQVTTTIQ